MFKKKKNGARIALRIKKEMHDYLMERAATENRNLTSMVIHIIKTDAEKYVKGKNHG